MHKPTTIAAEALEEYLDLHEWQIQAIQESLDAVDNNEVISFESIKHKWIPFYSL